ncbi:histidine--tRNA ligase [Candidatus Parcubacteria bacterium]|nr:MAG: histidine--tRNA ligase [Candidatus Parcubacteria bacterium]
MKKPVTVKPELMGGVRDMLPEEAIVFFDFVEKITGVYKKFGFVPLETPCMEKLPTLTGNIDDFDKSIFRTKVVKGMEDKSLKSSDLGEESALRFDLTVPLARVVSAYPEIPKPFKRYQLGKVFRGERPQAGRYREFYQLDFDIIGSSSLAADLETIQIMYEVMKILEVDNFLIKFNSRKILAGLADSLGEGDKIEEIIRIIDKLDKIGMDGVVADLQKSPGESSSGSALLNKEQAIKVKDFLEISRESKDIVGDLKTFFNGVSGLGMEGVLEIEYLANGLKNLGVQQKYWEIDLSVARGLGYYNGPVFEVILKDLPGLGSVFSGGRYDGLTSRFIKNSNIGGVGASVGLDRLIVGLKQLGKINEKVSQSSVVVAVFNESLSQDSILVANELRKADINTEVYLGSDTSLKNQIAYALKKNAKFVVIIGPDEKEQEKVQLKDLDARIQETITMNECVKKIKKSVNK